MDNTALDITGLTKRYRDFTLDDVSFSVPCGTVVGFIGENGAGKSTTLKTILGLIKKDAGTISVLGKQEKDIDFKTRSKIGVVFDGNNYPDKLTPKQLSGFLNNVYIWWDEEKYFSMLDSLSLPAHKKVKTFSKRNEDEVGNYGGIRFRSLTKCCYRNRNICCFINISRSFLKQALCG